MRFKHYLHIVIVLILAASFSAVGVHAQTEESKTNNSLKDGAWALQFQIGSNFTLSSFQGKTISVKKHYSNFAAVRVGITGESQFTTEKRFYSDTARATEWDGGGNNSQFISLIGQYLFYPNPEARVNVFFGGGPILSFSRTFQNTDYVSDSQYRAYESNQWGAGAIGVLGVECFVLSELSLHAEYGVSLQHFWNKYTTETRLFQNNHLIGTSGYTEKTWRLSNSVKFGLSVYF